jgi:membrane-bound lytic murein transglycosylase D
VERFVTFWTTEMRGFTERTLMRASPYLDMIRGQLRRNQLPEVFCYLPFMESGFRTEIPSRAGARGLWQFMPDTARKYGLRVDEAVDERTDPARATEAACRYLNDLLSMFGANAFMCAVASYNKGEYGMLNCLRGVSWRSTWKYWDIVAKNDGCLKRETIEYVPKFLAAAIVIRRPAAFGLEA